MLSQGRKSHRALLLSIAKEHLKTMGLFQNMLLYCYLVSLLAKLNIKNKHEAFYTNLKQNFVWQCPI